jgi:hypothetical protein
MGLGVDHPPEEAMCAVLYLVAYRQVCFAFYFPQCQGRIREGGNIIKRDKNRNA